MIAAQASAEEGLDYIDIHTPMLDAHGGPRAELFASDRLHLNPQGYRLWQAVMAEHLR